MGVPLTVDVMAGKKGAPGSKAGKTKAKAGTLGKRTIHVVPSRNIFPELGHNNYSDVDILSELIDNALANRVSKKRLNVNIEVGVSGKTPSKSYFVIRDNASGIDEDKLGAAISPGATANNAGTLSEHGLGMKAAIASAGVLDYLKTKVATAEYALVIREFDFGDLVAEQVEVDWDHGTEIRVKGLKEILSKVTNTKAEATSGKPTKAGGGGRQYNERIKAYLGARYRQFMVGESPVLDLTIEWCDLDNGEKRTIIVEPVRPIYRHPSTGENRPVVPSKIFKGKGWKAQLKFGYAPVNEAEYKELGLDEPKEYEPYATSLKHQGLDIVRNQRVINFHQLASIGLVPAPHNRFNHLRGEIELQEGFHTASTKNRLVEDEHFQEMVEEVRSYLEEEKLLDRKKVPGEVPEVILRDRLKAHLLTRKQNRKKKVSTEFAIQALGGAIDLLCDDEEVWEVKMAQAGGIDVYQLFAYMDMGDFERGYLVAPSFSTGAEEAADFVSKKHNVSIECVPLSDFPVNDAVTNSEIVKYKL
jgi:hypothetical protein